MTRKTILTLLFSACLGTATADDWQTPAKRDDGWPVRDVTGSWDTAALQGIEQGVAAGELKQLTGVLVARRGELVFERYFGEGGPAVLNDIRSAGKTITSLLVGQAIAAGHLPGVEARVAQWFEDSQPWAHPDERKDAITIEDLLTMSSVMECNDWNNFSRGNEERMYLVEDWERFFWDLPIRGIPPWETPVAERPYGRAHSYCTAGVFVLGSLVERASGSQLEAFANEHLFRPLGIDGVTWPVSSLGIAQGGGGIRITGRDLLKIGQLALARGLWQERRLVPESWIEASFEPRARVDTQAEQPVDFGYLWWIFSFRHGDRNVTAYAAAGNGGNYLFVLPDLELVVVVTSVAYNKPYMHEQSRAVLTDYVLPALPASPE